MKQTTQVSDIRRVIALDDETQRFNRLVDEARRQLDRLILSGVVPLTIPNGEEIVAGRKAMDQAAEAVKRLPKDRAAMAREVVKWAKEEAVSIAASMGGDYSGDVSFTVKFGSSGTGTTTSIGDQYSRRCTYRKTDAVHQVAMNPEGLPELFANERLRQMSNRDGLPLIFLKPDGEAVWVRSAGKRIEPVRGWIIGGERCCYHSTKSREDAVKGHARKLAALEAQEKAERESRKIDRRARLVARLCQSIKATVEDARAMGYCLPGIAQFRERHHIGETASLPELCRTGNPMAIRLALNLARKAIHTHN